VIKKYSIWLLIFFSSLIYTVYSLIRHYRYESLIFDLGVYDQIIWLFAKGKPFFSSILEAHPWGDHFTPALLLLAPLFYLWDNASILLIFQAIFVCLGAYPLYLLAKKKTNHQLFALTISFTYLFFYGIQNAIAFDFHPIVLATTLLAWLFWAYEEKKSKLFWLLIILIILLQENFFLLISAFGLFLILQYKDYRRGIFIFIANLILFYLVIQVIIPYFGQNQFTYYPSHLKNASLLDIVKMFFIPVSKIEVIFVSLLSFAFFPAISISIWPLLLEEFAQRFIGTPINTRWNLGFQYNSILAPILAFGTINIVSKYFSKHLKKACLVIILCLILVQITKKPALNDFFDLKFYDFTSANTINPIMAKIPPTASIAASNNLGPHLTHRQNIIFLTNCHDNPTVWRIDMKRCFQLNPDYLFADLSPTGDLYPDYSKDSILNLFRYLQDTGEYRQIESKNNIYLLIKNNQ
jgi:uncharacterized membrane protein